MSKNILLGVIRVCTLVICAIVIVNFIHTNLSREKDVDELIIDLRNKKPDVRAKAAEALGNIGRKYAVESLMDALKDEDASCRAAAAQALGRIEDVRAVNPLINVFKDRDSKVRVQAISALGRIADPKTIDPLVACLDDNDQDVQEAAQRALTYSNASCVESLAAAFKDKDWHGEWRAINILRSKGALVPAADALIFILKNNANSIIRAQAAEALGEIKDLRAVTPLINALEDKDKFCKIAAIEALGEIKDPRAIAPLVTMLESEDWDIRDKSAMALGSIGDPAFNILKDVLKGKDKAIRIAAGRALGYMETHLASEFLENSFKNKDLFIISAAHMFYIRNGKPGSEDILIEALNAYDDTGIVEGFLNSGNTKLREAAELWAKKHSYDIVAMPKNNSSYVTWGRK
jgi:HEAT repeat protein